MPRLTSVMPVLLPALFAICALPATASVAPDPSGAWLRGDGKASVRIAPCGAQVCATNTWIKDPSSGEAVGDRLVMTLTPRTGTELAGTAYDPKRNMTYKVEVTVEPTEMVTRGCILFGLVCRSVAWSRAP